MLDGSVFKVSIRRVDFCTFGAMGCKRMTAMEEIEEPAEGTMVSHNNFLISHKTAHCPSANEIIMRYIHVRVTQS